MNNAWRIGNHITGNNKKKVGVIKMKEVKLKEIMNLIKEIIIKVDLVMKDLENLKIKMIIIHK